MILTLSNIFVATVGRVPKMLPRRCGQRRFNSDAADPHGAPRQQYHPHGQEHHDAQGHQGPFGDQPSSGEAAAPHQGQCRLRLHSW